LITVNVHRIFRNIAQIHNHLFLLIFFKILNCAAAFCCAII